MTANGEPKTWIINPIIVIVLYVSLPTTNIKTIQPTADSTDKATRIINDYENLQRPFKSTSSSAAVLDRQRAVSWNCYNTTATTKLSLQVIFTCRLRHLGKCSASLNRSLILATWFIHVATADITTPINHTVRYAGRPRTQAGLTNLSTIFHLNNLALPQGKPTPDSPLEGSCPRTFISFTLGTKTFCRLSEEANTVLCAPRQESPHSQPLAIIRNCFMDIRGTNQV